MESIDENLNDNGMELSGLSITHLRETAKWANFIAIVAFIGLGLMVIGALMLILLADQAPASMIYNSPMPFRELGVTYLVLVLVYFFPVFYLSRFALRMKQGLDRKDSRIVEQATGFQRAMYRYVGILLIIVISIYALGILIGLLAGR